MVTYAADLSCSRPGDVQSFRLKKAEMPFTERLVWNQHHSAVGSQSQSDPDSHLREALKATWSVCNHRTKPCNLQQHCGVPLDMGNCDAENLKKNIVLLYFHVFVVFSDYLPFYKRSLL